MEQRIIDFFNSNVETILSEGESLVGPLTESATLIVEALLAGVRVFTCGNGLSSSQAAGLSFILLHQFRIERPGFASFCLSSDALISSGLTEQANFAEIYRRQLRALAQENDLLILFTANSNAGNLVQAVQTAHEKQMTVIAFTGAGDNNISAMLTAGDVEIRVEHSDPYRVHILHTLSQHCLCDLIEYQLFGG